MARPGIAAGTCTFMAAVVISFFVPAYAYSHCDTLDGPVVRDAKAALEKGDLSPVLKWVNKEQEGELGDAFKKTIAVRSKGAEARELADMYFYETTVRLHRASEGAPYTGLAPQGTDSGPAVTGADKALETGSIDDLAKLITDTASAGLRERFQRTTEAGRHAGESVEAGREYVSAYVEYVHYVEKLYDDASGKAGHHAEGTTTGHEGPPAASHVHD